MRYLTDDPAVNCHPISKKEIEDFKANMRVGDSYFIKVDVPPSEEDRKNNRKAKQTKKLIVTVEAKYPFIVKTNIGVFQYPELIIAMRRYKE